MNVTDVHTGEDSSWVVIDTPLAPEALREFCGDLERLYRINPYLEIQSWTPTGAGRARVAWRNLSNRQATELELHRVRESDNAFAVSFSAGIKHATHFRLEPAGAGSRLTITDRYDGLPPDERTRRLDEVDRSLNAWGWALHAHLRREHRWGANPLWRWTMRRVWLPMRPSARRITTLIVLVSIAEFVFFLLVALIYWSEHR